MDDFTYWAPTKVVFGKGAESRVGQEVAAFGGHKVLVHYGDTFLQENGTLDRVHKSLTAAGLEYIDLDGVVPNPRLSLIRKGIELCKQQGVDFILPIGGGSAMDSGKGIAYGLANDFDIVELLHSTLPFKFYRTHPGEKIRIAKLGCICTIAATGSEMSNSMVITIDDEHVKRSYIDDTGRPLFAIMNPEITFTLPKYQMACGCADMMMHTMERYFCKANGTELTDSIAEALMRTVRQAALAAIKQPIDYDARSTLMWAGSLSHNGLTGCGRMADWGTHKLQAEVGGMFPSAHGAGVAALWGSWARYCLDVDPARFAKFGLRVFNVPENLSDIKGMALRGIEEWEKWLKAIGMPTSLAELGVKPTDEQIDQMAQSCIDSNGEGFVGNFKKLYKEDCIAIYKAAR